MALSQDGTVLAASSGMGDVNCYDAVTGKLVRRLVGKGERLSILGFAPDGKTLFVMSGKSPRPGNAQGRCLLARRSDAGHGRR